jgi:EpsI family protein
LKRSQLGLALLVAAMLAASAAGHAMKPHIMVADVDQIDLDALVPRLFGAWISSQDNPPAIVDPAVQRMIDTTYSHQLSRTYTRSDGYSIMLSVAYGRDQRGAHMAHPPEICYPSQGFTIQAPVSATLATRFGPIPVQRMFAVRGPRIEPVTYWFTEGDTAIRDGLQRRFVAIRYGLSGEIPDGVLFRVSTIDPNANNAYAQEDAFVSDLMAAISPAARTRLAGLR